jgi:hypothetical protein
LKKIEEIKILERCQIFSPFLYFKQLFDRSGLEGKEGERRERRERRDVERVGEVI